LRRLHVANKLPQNRGLTMKSAQTAFSVAMAIALLVLGASNALAVTMKAVMSGTFDDRFINYDYGVFGNGSEGSLSGLPFRITFLYDLENLDLNTGGFGGIWYGAVDPVKSAILQVGDFDDPTKSYDFDADQYGEIRLNDKTSNFMLLFDSFQTVFHQNNYYKTFISASIRSNYPDKRGNFYRGPNTLSEPISLVGDNGFPIGGVGFVIYDKSQGGYVSYGTAYIDRLEITNADDVPPSIVPVPHALPLLASALIAFGALRCRVRNLINGSSGT
jgi:hypothetical protein